MASLFNLFITFARIGLFTFGGGYAMIAFIEKACVENYAWITHDEMMDITVIAESTPGPIAINCATYVGFKQRGFIGALVSTAGIVLPSLLVILLIASFLDNFLEIELIAHAFWGIKLAVGILIIDAAWTMMKKMKKKPLPVTIAAVAGVVMLAADIWALNVSSILIMLVAGFISLAIFFAQSNLRKQSAAPKGGAR